MGPLRGDPKVRTNKISYINLLECILQARRLRKREGQMKSRMQTPVCLPTACSSSSSKITIPLLRRAGFQLLKGHLRWDSCILNNKALAAFSFQKNSQGLGASPCTDSAPCETRARDGAGSAHRDGERCPGLDGVTLQHRQQQPLQQHEQERSQQGQQDSLSLRRQE